VLIPYHAARANGMREGCLRSFDRNTLGLIFKLSLGYKYAYWSAEKNWPRLR
jgi:hypothetical protein